MRLPCLIVGICLSLLGCDNVDSDVPAAPINPDVSAVVVSKPVAKVTAVRVHGPMPVIEAEQRVSESLPEVLACWQDSADPPCGTISITTGGDRHGNRMSSVSGTVQPDASRVCVQEIIRGIRPSSPKHSPPGAGLTVDMVLAPSQDAIQSCSGPSQK